jgi:hypothetical protein
MVDSGLSLYKYSGQQLFVNRRECFILWQNHLRNEGSILQDPDRVILNKARMQQTHVRII